MPSAHSRGQEENLTATLSVNIDDAPTVVRSARLGTDIATGSRGLELFLHKHRLPNGSCEDLAVIQLAVTHEELESEAYPYILKTEEEVLFSIGAMFTSGYYVWRFRAMLLRPPDTLNPSPIRNERHITMDSTEVSPR